MVWGVMFTLLFALWLPVLWLREPEQNVDDEIDLVSRSVHRGSLWFQVADEENPTGFGCERCHGPKGVGGQTIIFNTPEGEQVEVQPPSLNNVCSRLPIEGTGGIRETIMQGRPGTPMPSWSVRFAGPMNDQQIQDLVSYVVELNEKTIGAGKDNLCLNPPAEGETTTTASPTPGASPTGGATPSPAPTTPGSP